MKNKIIAASICFAVVPQAQAVTGPALPHMLPAGSVVSGGTGKADSVDLYSFMTLPGDTHEITVLSNSKKPLEVQLLDPGGNVIMQSSGVGKVEIEAIAAWGDAYSVAVIRSDLTAKYSIQRITTAGTLQQFAIAHMVGYKRGEGLFTTRCWIEPGKSIKVDFDTFVSERRIEGLQTLERHIQKNGGKDSSSVRTMTIDGDVIAISEEEAGEIYKTTLDLKLARLRYDPVYKFTGYLCAS